MTDYDRGEFVRNRTITIQPCANGTFVVTQGTDDDPLITSAMGFSSAADMLKFLQSEYSIDPRGQGENPDKAQRSLVLRMVDEREKTGLSLDDIAKACDWPLVDVKEAIADRAKLST